MGVLAIRALAAAATAATVLLSSFLINPDSDKGPPFRAALARLSEADSFHLELVRNGEPSEVWGQKSPTRIRWNLSDGTYCIDNGTQLWKIDEKANQAITRQSSLFEVKQNSIDLTHFLGLPTASDYARLARQRPVESIELNGSRCNVYRWSNADGREKVRVEAVVSAVDSRLRSVETVLFQSGERIATNKLTVCALNQPLNEELFRIADTLTEDGRIGKVLDAQGLVSVRPLSHTRWTPVDSGTVLKPGDWLRCNPRGANAALVRLVQQSHLTVGPGTLVELVSPEKVRVVSGELKIVAERNSPVTIVGPNQQKQVVKGTQILRLRNDQLTKPEQQPGWLSGFEGITTKEGIGSLVANIDGRDEPLTVGYHKVTVDIRDQIARTVIEESFVNHTKNQLEGVFYFPLPQEASISGFGMWIDGELVEADVVEKQRAREIYETILREKRDPGLLEWTGGSMFKARVFPILAHSEKRITLTYTQVLPLKQNRYRYTYSLQSEMLKQHPLRELAINVNISSNLPLASVSSPTHAARINRTKHSARVEFSAQEYTPERDFEVSVGLASQPSTALLIPHQRGDDGYFMLQVVPPADMESTALASGSGAEREFVADGKPLKLLLIADTSASMRGDAREIQKDFLSAILSALSPKDSFNLLMCDVDSYWLYDEPVPADPRNVDTALTALEERVSLGWTNLDKAFSTVIQQADEQTHVVYLGDGVVTTENADPIAFGKRLRRLYESNKSTMHAVAVSSSYEPPVLKTIASLGGGSFRKISNPSNVQTAARELLAEITHPVTRITGIEFQGLRTARVYPRQLPNLADGTQQILLGRYLPEKEDAEGKIIVSVERNGRPLQITAPFQLKQGEEGNSFIPRLWARMHLNALLEQGSSQAIKDEIIALSEEYHIITPYTSLLVLESDEDRERFKVKRRFQMRDGERFFAEGRDQIDYELLQQQMRQAGEWRIRLRMQVLRELAGLGRQSIAQRHGYHGPHGGMGGGFGGGMEMGGGMSGPVSSTAPTPWRFNEQLGQLDTKSESRPAWPISGEPWSRSSQRGSFGFHDRMPGLALEDTDALVPTDGNDYLPVEGKFKRQRNRMPFAPGREAELEYDEVGYERYASAIKMEARLSSLSDRKRGNKPRDLFFASTPYGPNGRRSTSGSYDANGHLWSAKSREAACMCRLRDIEGPSDSRATQWLNTLLPHLPAPPSEPRDDERESRWSDEARTLAESLLRKELLTRPAQPLEINRESRHYDPRWQNLTSYSHARHILSHDKWLVRTGGHGSQTIVQYCDGKQRSIYGRAFRLGRTRPATDSDLRNPPLSLGGHVLTSLERSYPNYRVELKPRDDTQVLLVLKHPTSPGYENHFLIDTQKDVILKIEHWQDGKIASTRKFGQFVKVSGVWFATVIQSFDAQQRRSMKVTQSFSELDEAKLADRLKQLQTDRDQVQWLHHPLPDVLTARKAIKNGKGEFEDHLVLLTQFASIQRWPRVFEHLQAIEELATEKPGLFWLRNAVLNVSRRRESLRERILSRAEVMASTPSERPDAVAATEELFLANHLVAQAAGFFEANEKLELLDVLKPLYERQQPETDAMKQWFQQRVDSLQAAGKVAETLALRRTLATDYPHDSNLQREYAEALVRAKEYDSAVAWIDRAVPPDAKWTAGEEDSLRNVITGLYRSSGRYAELVEYLERWVSTKPKNEVAYQQYLTALFKNNQVDKANGLMENWLKDATQLVDAPPHMVSRAEAATQHALGSGYRLNTNRLDERWLDPLANIVLAYARHPEWTADAPASIADRIMRNHRFSRTDHHHRLLRKLVPILSQQLADIPYRRANYLVNWVFNADLSSRQDYWQQVARTARRRRESEENPRQRHPWGQLLGRILSRKIGMSEYLDFLRCQMREGPQEHRILYCNTLFNELLKQPWSREREAEAAALLPKLSGSKDPVKRLCAQVEALQRLTNAMVNARFQSLMKNVENPSELTRTELGQAQTSRLNQAMEQYARQLDVYQRRAPENLVPWMVSEWTFLQVHVGEKLDEAIGRCWEFLGNEPIRLNVEERPRDVLRGELAYRYLITLANLSARQDAPEGLSERLLRYIDKAIETASGSAPAWKNFKFRLLVALDRPEQLAKLLNEWIDQNTIHADRWRVALGYLLAEEGKVKDAIKCYEPLHAQDLLGPSELEALRDWYLVVSQKEKYEEALRSRLKMTSDSDLGRWLNGQLEPLRRGSGGRGDVNPFGDSTNASAVPQGMHENVPKVFTVLFAKSTNPSHYLNDLRQFYRYTHDFRLLAGVAESVVGHTAGKVYPFLEGINRVLDEVRQEATVDSLSEHLGGVRERVQTQVDRRAVDLLEMLIERRAAELANQSEPHAAKALAAMQRAFKGEWTAGEPRLMANLLASLGRIAVRKLADEQVRQLESLHEAATVGSVDRLRIAANLARTYWAYSRHDRAINLLEATLNEYQAACERVLPAHANAELDLYVNYLKSRGHYARGERVLKQQLDHPVSTQQSLWLTQRLYHLYNDALESNGNVTLGTGVELYRELTRRLQQEIDHPVGEHRRELMQQLIRVYRTAHEKTISHASEDLIAFTRNRLPEVLRQQINGYHDMVGQVASAVEDLAGTREALAVVIRFIQNEPKGLIYTGEDGWREHAGRLASWRSEVKDLGDLEEPLLDIVTAELRRELESRESRHRGMYWQYYGHFWAEKRAAFLRTAETVHAQRKDSDAAVEYIARYVARGLDHYGRAIEMLWAAHRDGILDTDGQWQLADYLHHEKRYGESIPILEPLVKENRDNISYRTKLMHAYFQTGRARQLLELLEHTDTYFHKNNRWTENIISQLASSCLQNELFEQSVAYYQEVIPLHKRTHPNRGIGNGTLSSYCQSLARAYAGCGQTAEAVDAACEAIVGWGPRQDQRANALHSLERVLREAPDLQQYVRQLDRESKEKGVDKPIVRKALGQVYCRKQEYAEAARQLEQAVALQPNDAESHQKLIECYEKLGKRPRVIKQSLALLELTPRDIRVYKDLANRYQKSGQADNVERTYTSIVEALPHEAKGHAMLAEIRQDQGRWQDAAAHWERVAEIRSREPTGFLKLAAAQIRLKQWHAAKETLAKLRSQSWPPRFHDVDAQVRQLEDRLK